MDEDSLKFLRGLRAVREFTPEAVDEGALKDILEVGRWTSTGGNRQGNEVVVVRDRSTLQKFAEWGAKPGGAAAVSLLLVTSSDMGVLDEGRMAERLALAARACGLGSVIATLKNEGPGEADLPPPAGASTTGPFAACAALPASSIASIHWRESVPMFRTSAPATDASSSTSSG